MSQEQRIKLIEDAFLDGTGRHLIFFNCIADGVQHGCSIEDVRQMVNAAESANQQRSARFLEVAP